MKKIESIVQKPFFYLTIFGLFFFYLSYNTPLTGDDWTWGTEKGIIRLKNFFDEYNGRYLSNTLEIILTRNDIIRYFFLTFFSTVYIYLIGKLFYKKDRHVFTLFAFVFTLTMPVNMFSQTFAWTAGYVNYVVSLVLLLVYLVLTKNVFQAEPPKYNHYLWIFMIPLGIATQLLVEHITLFSIFLAFYIICYTYVKFKTYYKVHITYAVSLVIGAIIMFTNRTYINVLLGTDSYRSLGPENEGVFQKLYNVYTGEMYKYLFLDSYIINIFIIVMITIILLKTPKGSNFSTLGKYILLLSSTFIFIFLTFIEPILDENYLGNKTTSFESLISILFFIITLITTIIYIGDKNIKMKLLLYFSGVIILSIPFIFITPYGPRAALAPFLFLVLSALELYNYNMQIYNWSNDIAKKILIFSTIILLIFYSIIFTRIGNTSRDRIQYLNEEVEKGAEVIELTEVPHSQFLWMSSTKREHFKNMFKEYYNVPEDTKIIFVPYYKDID